MKKIKKVYLDMDGVLADFELFFNENVEKGLHYYVSNPELQEEFKAIKKELVHVHKMFANLKPMKDAKTLVDGLMKLGVEHGFELEVLTAVGGYETDLAVQQKQAWLTLHFPELIFGYCVRSSHKALKANSESILIDDRSKALNPFIEAGGIGVLHTSAEKTLEDIKKLLAHKPSFKKV